MSREMIEAYAMSSDRSTAAAARRLLDGEGQREIDEVLVLTKFGERAADSAKEHVRRVLDVDKVMSLVNQGVPYEQAVAYPDEHEYYNKPSRSNLITTVEAIIADWESSNKRHGLGVEIVDELTKRGVIR